MRAYVNFIRLSQDSVFFTAPAPKVKLTLPDVNIFEIFVNNLECSLSIPITIQYLIRQCDILMYVYIVLSVVCCCLKFKFAKILRMDKQLILENQIESLKDIVDIQERQLSSKFQGINFLLSLVIF
jgi:hypothetical protein